MATREGIYVGGHEIVQRYVGSRLVWEKNKLILIGTLPYNFTSSDTNSVEFRLDTLNKPYEIEEYAKYRSSIVVERMGYRFKNISVSVESKKRMLPRFDNASVNIRQYEETEGRIIIHFVNPSDKYNFLSKSGSTSFYKNKR